MDLDCILKTRLTDDATADLMYECYKAALEGGAARDRLQERYIKLNQYERAEVKECERENDTADR